MNKQRKYAEWLDKCVSAGPFIYRYKGAVSINHCFPCCPENHNISFHPTSSFHHSNVSLEWHWHQPASAVWSPESLKTDFRIQDLNLPPLPFSYRPLRPPSLCIHSTPSPHSFQFFQLSSLSKQNSLLCSNTALQSKHRKLLSIFPRSKNSAQEINIKKCFSMLVIPQRSKGMWKFYALTRCADEQDLNVYQSISFLCPHPLITWFLPAPAALTHVHLSCLVSEVCACTCVPPLLLWAA